jgi:hypothetical protein
MVSSWSTANKKKILVIEYDHGKLCRVCQIPDVAFHVGIGLRPLLDRGLLGLLAGLISFCLVGP